MCNNLNDNKPQEIKMSAKVIKQKLEQEAAMLTLELYNIDKKEIAINNRLDDIQKQINVLTLVVQSEEKEIPQEE